MVPDFIIQWGIPADPAAYAKWGDSKIKDDPVRVSNAQGTLSFATSGPDARGSQVFVNLGNNDGLDEQGFAPFGVVEEGLEAFALMSSKVGDIRDASGKGPDQSAAKSGGNAYLKEKFPTLSYIAAATVL